MILFRKSNRKSLSFYLKLVLTIQSRDSTDADAVQEVMYTLSSSEGEVKNMVMSLSQFTLKSILKATVPILETSVYKFVDMYIFIFVYVIHLT